MRCHAYEKSPTGYKEVDRVLGPNYAKRYEGEKKVGVKYSEVVKGKVVSSEANGDGKENNCDHPLIFQSLEGEIEWLKGAYLGRLRPGFSWKEHGEELKNECVGSLKITILENNVIIIFSETGSPTEELLRGYEEWTEFWLCELRPWTSSDVSQNREVWTKWVGIPLQAWNDRFFGLASSQVGNMVEIHEQTRQRCRFDAAFLKIATGLKPINKEISCQIDGVCFKIYVEEINCMHIETTLLESLEEDEESGSDAEFSELHLKDSTDADSVEAEEGRQATCLSDEEATVEGVGKVSTSDCGLEHACGAAPTSSHKVPVTSDNRVSLNNETGSQDVVVRNNPYDRSTTAMPNTVPPNVPTIFSEGLGRSLEAHDIVVPCSITMDVGNFGPGLTQQAESQTWGVDSHGAGKAERGINKGRGVGVGDKRRGRRNWKNRARERKEKTQAWDDFIHELESDEGTQLIGQGMKRRMRGKIRGSSVEGVLGKDGWVFCKNLGLDTCSGDGGSDKEMGRMSDVVGLGDKERVP